MPSDKRHPAEKDEPVGSRARRADLQEEPSNTEAGTGNAAPAAKGPAAEEGASLPFPVVGIGASAGGLEALEAFFKALPEDSGMAIVVVTHTDPQKASLLPDIIERHTTVTVKRIEDGMPARPDAIFLPPSDKDVVLEGETLRLRDRPARDELHMPVDLFLKSIAGERGERAAGVILSGTGTDGSYGLHAIKENAGLAIAQDPAAAKHSGMPRSAIETGLVDIVTTAEAMPGRMVAYFRHPAPGLSAAAEKSAPRTERIDSILSFLARHTRHDFSLYKPSTLERRIARRMTVTQSSNVTDYVKRLQEDHAESRALFQDLLIGVTNFFRDPEAFAFLKEKILPGMFARTQDNGHLRVWVAGCATGEEVYSIAILFQEYMAENQSPRELQIFGTDIDPRAIEKARLGRYPKNIATDVGSERLERFFSKGDNHYRVTREVREPVIFAEQNVLRDPPFSDLDLLVCRNLLIYLRTEAQDRVIPLFHHVLRKDGILFLGNSESIGRFSQLFESLSKSYSIFRKREQALGTPVHFPTGKIDPSKLHEPKDAEEETPSEKPPPSLHQAVETLLLQTFTPACAVVNLEGDVVFTRGRTGDYLELAQGRPNLNIADMAREGLRFPLIAALRKAREREGWVQETGLRVPTNGDHRWVDLKVRRFTRAPLKDHLVVVMETGREPGKTPPREGGATTPEDLKAGRIQELEQELLRLRQEYRSAREELETSNEELRSSNEELQSSNEELQSTNEELESSREELHSLNEELNTVNDELNNKITELQHAFQAVTETLDSTRIAMVFLDRELRVTRFTQEATGLVNLIDSDVGRPLEHIADNLKGARLTAKARRVLDTLEPHETEIETTDGHWYRMNVLVHRREQHRIEGVVITFVNIDAQKAAQEKVAAQARQFTESIVATVREALLVLDDELRVLTANRSFYETFRADPQGTEGKTLFELGDGQWEIPELRGMLEKVVADHQTFEGYRVAHTFPTIGEKVIRLNARHLREEDPEQNKVLLAIEDVTERADR